MNVRMVAAVGRNIRMNVGVVGNVAIVEMVRAIRKSVAIAGGGIRRNVGVAGNVGMIRKNRGMVGRDMRWKVCNVGMIRRNFAIVEKRHRIVNVVGRNIGFIRRGVSLVRIGDIIWHNAGIVGKVDNIRRIVTVVGVGIIRRKDCTPTLPRIF